MKPYTATLQFEHYWSLRNLTQVLRGDRFVAERVFHAENRRAAVRKALQWFSTRFNCSVGPPWQVLSVDDPYHEVVYDQDFSCSDLRNKFLPEYVVERLIAESNDELVRDGRPSKLGHPLCAVRRRKRRVKFKPKAIAPCVYQNDCGSIFYRVVEKPQVTRSGALLSKRKTRLIRLAARTLPEALEEIQVRRLFALNRSSRVISKRSLSLLQHFAAVSESGLTPRRPNGNGAAGPKPWLPSIRRAGEPRRGNHFRVNQGRRAPKVPDLVLATR